MRNIDFKNVSKSFDGESILDNLSLSIPSGKFFALLGPSGCGKTSILRLIAGFETPDSGSIFLGDMDITHLPVHERRVNTVFQNYALFPHMNVFENIAYGLVVKNLSKDAILQRVNKALKTVRLENHSNKDISQLSGGQQQRVALARAIINEPEVLLLDEPLAALDLNLREQVLIELSDLQESLQTTFVYVTHDQTEALTVSDQIAIMNHDGEIEQIGTPRDIYEFPISSFVAKFVGSMNLFNGIFNLENDSSIASVQVSNLGSFQVSVSEKNSKTKDGANIIMAIRPEKIWISKKKELGFSNSLSGIVKSIVYHGRTTQYNVTIENEMVVEVFEQNEDHFQKDKIDYDDNVYLSWQKENVVILEK